MMGIRIGLAFAAGLCILLLATLWVAAQTIPQEQPPVPPLEIAQTASFVLTATAGADSTRCAASATAQVRANSPVYYCFTIQNTGSVTLTSHQISLARRGVITTSFPMTVAPGAVVDTFSRGLVVTDVSDSDVDNLVTWTARATNPPIETTLTDQTNIDIVNPAVSVVKTIAQNPRDCGTTSLLTIPSGQTAYYCLTVQNTGDIPLTRHTVQDSALNVNGNFNYTLTVGESLVITTGRLNSLGVVGALQRSNVIGPFVNTVILNSTTAGGLQASARNTATVSVGTTTALFTKTVGTDPNTCATTTTLVAQPGSQLYYCLSVVNTGVVTLTHHSFVEPPLSIDLRFPYSLTPRSLLTVTTSFLDRFGLPDVLGPFEISSQFPNVVNGTMTYSGTAPGGFSVVLNSSTSATMPTPPTATATDQPDATDTATPFPTSTPSITPIPPTATPSPTPTFTPVTPSPTPTRSYAISLLATPTSAQPTPTPTLFVDPAFFPVTLTAQAAAATAAATPFFSPLATPTLDALLFPAPEVPTFAPALSQTPELPLETPTATEPPPTPVPTDTPAPTSSPTPHVVLVVITDTPAPGVSVGVALPPGQRPVVYPAPSPTPDALLMLATMFDAALAAAGWIWFLLGSLVFFASAGVIAGLFFRQQEVRRFELVEGEEEIVLPEAIPAQQPRGLDSDDEWPDSLP
jgi:hypothetical protein